MGLKPAPTNRNTPLISFSDGYDPDYPSGWFVVFPKSYQLDLANEDNAVACFKFESQAMQFSERWGQLVAIIKNGIKSND